MRQFFDGYRLLYICQGLERQNMPDHVEQLNGPEDGRGSLLPSVCSFGHSTGRYLFCLCSLNLVTSASLLYPSEKPGSLGMTPCFSHPFGGNHKFLLRCYTLTFFFFFWLCWVFIAAHRLFCICDERGLLMGFST